MSQPILRHSIEELVKWYPRLFLEPHIVAATSVLSRYSYSPAVVKVKCNNIESQWLGKRKEFSLNVFWTDETAAKAERLRVTMQSKSLVELASIALALIIWHQVTPVGQLEVTDYGDSADFRSLSMRRVLEVSGTETRSELGRRHREKVEQAASNRFGWDAYVVVCAFGAKEHRVRFSGHPAKESHGGEKR